MIPRSYPFHLKVTVYWFPFGIQECDDLLLAHYVLKGQFIAKVVRLLLMWLTERSLPSNSHGML